MVKRVNLVSFKSVLTVKYRNVFVKHYAPNYKLVPKKITKLITRITLIHFFFFQKFNRQSTPQPRSAHPSFKALAQIVIKMSYSQECDEQMDEEIKIKMSL